MRFMSLQISAGARHQRRLSEGPPQALAKRCRGRKVWPRGASGSLSQGQSIVALVLSTINVGSGGILARRIAEGMKIPTRVTRLLLGERTKTDRLEKAVGETVV